MISLMHGWFDNLLQIDCDTDGQHNPDFLRKRHPDDLVEIIQRLQQEAVATGRLFVESKTQAQRVCCTSCMHFPGQGQELVMHALLPSIYADKYGQMGTAEYGSYMSIDTLLHSFLLKLINWKQRLQLASRRKNSLKPCIWISCKDKLQVAHWNKMTMLWAAMQYFCVQKQFLYEFYRL